MGKVVGIALILGGIVGVLYDWIESQKMREKRVEEFAVFIHKFIFAMETEKVKVIDYFSTYSSKDEVLQRTLQEVVIRLKENMYPTGQSVWDEVLREEGKSWGIDKDVLDVIIKCGIGFFGRCKEENITYLKKQLTEIENLQMRKRQKDTKERKVWIPVSLLGGMMVVILFL